MSLSDDYQNLHHLTDKLSSLQATIHGLEEQISYCESEVQHLNVNLKSQYNDVKLTQSLHNLLALYQNELSSAHLRINGYNTDLKNTSKEISSLNDKIAKE